MKKIAFVFSCLSALTGLVVIIITSILNKVMPKLGRVAFQAAAAGSYSEANYKMNFILINVIAVVMIIIGIVFSVRMYKQSDDK